MPLSASIGKGKANDPFEAGRNAARDVITSLGNIEPEAGFLFGSSGMDQQKFLDGVRSVAPNTVIIGCTTAGHATPEGVVDDGGMFLGFRSEGKMIALAIREGDIQGKEVDKAKSLIAHLRDGFKGSPLSALFLLSDGLVGSGTDLAEGLSPLAPASLAFFGTCAGDDMHFKATQLYEGKTPSTGAVVGLGLSGIPVGVASEHGWKPIGIPMVATKVEGALLLELDHQPAFSIYEKYFGDMASELKDEPLSRLAISYPLGIRETHGETLVRTPLSIDDNGGILAGAEISTGTKIQLMIGSKDGVVASATRAAERAKQLLGGRPAKAVLVMSSMSRRKLLGANAISEIRAVSSIFGPTVPIAQFYGYGEFVRGEGEIVNFQNQSILVAAFGETNI